MKLTLALVLLSTAACQRDETISGYADPATTWRLAELDGTPFPAGATLTFPTRGRVAGHGPCNAFRARQSVPLPWIAIEGLSSDEAACPQLEDERRYHAALRAMMLAEVAGDVLILSNDAGREMIFRADR